MTDKLWIKLEFGDVGFLGQELKTNIQTGPHWWETSALTTAPSLPPF